MKNLKLKNTDIQHFTFAENKVSFVKKNFMWRVHILKNNNKVTKSKFNRVNL